MQQMWIVYKYKSFKTVNTKGYYKQLNVSLTNLFLTKDIYTK